MLMSSQLKIFPCTLSHFECLLHCPTQFKSRFGYTVPSPFVESTILELGHRYLFHHPEVNPWWIHLFTYQDSLVGLGGYKGPPNHYTEVELGYEISHPYRNQGLATLAVQALCQKAYAQLNSVKIIAHTLAIKSPSTQVLTKCHFQVISRIQTTEEGELWKWQHCGKQGTEKIFPF